MPMKWTQLTVFKASAKPFRTDRKTPACLTAIGVWTLGRIERALKRARLNGRSWGEVIDRMPRGCSNVGALSERSCLGLAATISARPVFHRRAPLREPRRALRAVGVRTRESNVRTSTPQRKSCVPTPHRITTAACELTELRVGRPVLLPGRPTLLKTGNDDAYSPRHRDGFARA
jgi:hypothetical protein